MLLKRGDKGTNVTIWQEFLNTLGYKLTVDGDFGPSVERASRSFQTANSLKADGVVGDETINAAKVKGFGGFAVNATIPQSTKLVLVSAGHTNVAGQDRGAAGNGFIEGVEAVMIRDHLAAMLRQKGVSVIEDGADGVSEPLKKAIVLANKADIAVEIHFNAGPPTATGIEVLSKPNKKALAQKLAGAISKATGMKLRGDAGWKSDSSGQHHRLGFCEAGGLIIEMCFISNPSDMALFENNFGNIITELANVLAAA